MLVHSRKSALKSDDGKLIMKCLPHVGTAVIHLGDWEVIDTTIKQYRKRFLQKDVNEGQNIKLFKRKLSLLVGIYDVYVA